MVNEHPSLERKSKLPEKKYLFIILIIIVTAVIVYAIAYSYIDKVAEETNSIVIYGDTRTGHDKHREVVASILKKNPKVVFHTGDLVADGTKSDQWDVFNEITSDLMGIVDFYPTIGNHENNSQLYFDNFTLPGNERWYTVEYEGVTFIVLDSTSDLDNTSEQFAWFESELMTKSIDDKLITIFHHPIYTIGKHKDDEMDIADTIVPLFEKYGVDVVFNGHNHNYERSVVNGIQYIVAGGGGAPLYDQERENSHNVVFEKKYHFCLLEITGDSLKMTAYDTESNILDAILI